MSRINYAAIDIGSNAVRLLIKSISSEAVGKQQFKKILLLRIPLRLGLDIFSDGELSERKARKLERLMKAYRHLMKIYDVRYYRACATSAMRDAKNGTAVIRQIAENSGVNIEIINGREEARIIYSNHLECVADRHGAYLYVDVGGGSTEINFLCDGILQSSVPPTTSAHCVFSQEKCAMMNGSVCNWTLKPLLAASHMSTSLGQAVISTKFIAWHL